MTSLNKKKIKELKKEWYEAIDKKDTSGGFEYAYWANIEERKRKQLKRLDKTF